MDLAEKITTLRKQKGWSQEELANRLDISRQSVSKWESRMSVPDLDKILKLSAIFNVSTDYLLKNEMEDMGSDAVPSENFAAGQEYGGYSEEMPRNNPHVVTREEAESYMDITRVISRRIAAAVSIYILSPVMLILLTGLSEEHINSMGEEAAAGMGLIILLSMVAVATVVVVFYGMKVSKYEYLEKEPICLEPGLRAVVEQRKEGFEDTYRKYTTLGIALCILSVVPLFLTLTFNMEEIFYIYAVCALLVIVSGGVFFLVWTGCINNSCQKLLEEGDYTRKNKQRSGIATFYWCLMTAVYLGISFTTERWERSWILWPCAGVLWAAICGLLDARKERK